jgi:hypothetical protein
LKKLIGTVVSVHVGDNEDMDKPARPSLQAELDGFVDDGHRGHSRVCYAGDTEPKGTVRRNNRQWSGVAMEELALIQNEMDLVEPITPASLGANITLRGIADFSRLPKGTRLIFPSGATLVIEMYNPPCAEMSEKIARLHTTHSGEPIHRAAFSLAARRLRGVVGVIDVPGMIQSGDEVIVSVYESS